jgi:putative tricarboxylic transport membrane protein
MKVTNRIGSFTATVALATLVALTPVGLAGAADWEPKEKIVFVTHSSPGNSIDIFLRTIADIWTKHKFAPRGVSVENMVGSGGEKARRYVAAQSRGNTSLIFGFTPQMMIAPIRTRSDINVGSFTSLALLTDEPTVLYVNAEAPFKTTTDLLEAARQKPKGILQGGGSYGGPTSLMGRMMADEAKVEIAYTPFKTSGESVVALLGGHVHFVLEQPSEVDEHIKAGKLRALATSTPLAQYPGVPTFESLGMKFRQLKRFRGVMAPPGIPAEAVEYYIRAFEKTRSTPEWKEYVRKFGVTEHWIAGKELAAFLQDEEKAYRKMMTDLGMLKK